MSVFTYSRKGRGIYYVLERFFLKSQIIKIEKLGAF
jgi:hypothetical protein